MLTLNINYKSNCLNKLIIESEVFIETIPLLSRNSSENGQDKQTWVFMVLFAIFIHLVSMIIGIIG